MALDSHNFVPPQTALQAIFFLGYGYHFLHPGKIFIYPRKIFIYPGMIKIILASINPISTVYSTKHLASWSQMVGRTVPGRWLNLIVVGSLSLSVLITLRGTSKILAPLPSETNRRSRWVVGKQNFSKLWLFQAICMLEFCRPKTFWIYVLGSW